MTAYNFRRTTALSTPREVSEVVNGLLDGRSNNTGSVTLRTSNTTTVVAELRSGLDSIILLMPTTANASAEVGAGTIYVSTRAKQSFTLTHASNSQADRTYAYTVIG